MAAVKLAPFQQEQLVEWLQAGLSNRDVRRRLEIYGWPDLLPSALSYWRKQAGCTRGPAPRRAEPAPAAGQHDDGTCLLALIQAEAAAAEPAPAPEPAPEPAPPRGTWVEVPAPSRPRGMGAAAVGLPRSPRGGPQERRQNITPLSAGAAQQEALGQVMELLGRFR